MSTITAATILSVPQINRETIADYASKWGASVKLASTPDNSEHLVVVGHDDHVFAAASSKVSPSDALNKLAQRIRAKAV